MISQPLGLVKKVLGKQGRNLPCAQGLGRKKCSKIKGRNHP